MFALSRRVAAILAVLVLFINRSRIRTMIKIIRELRHGAEIVRRLPGPEKKHEHIIFGHVGGPLFVKEGEVFSPEWLVENSVEKFCEVSRNYREAGIMRCKWNRVSYTAIFRNNHMSQSAVILTKTLA